MALIDSGADDWRVALTTERAIKLTIELIVCAICPFPGFHFILSSFFFYRMGFLIRIHFVMITEYGQLSYDEIDKKVLHTY